VLACACPHSGSCAASHSLLATPSLVFLALVVHLLSAGPCFLARAPPPRAGVAVRAVCAGVRAAAPPAVRLRLFALPARQRLRAAGGEAPLCCNYNCLLLAVVHILKYLCMKSYTCTTVVCCSCICDFLRFLRGSAFAPLEARRPPTATFCDYDDFIVYVFIVVVVVCVNLLPAWQRLCAARVGYPCAATATATACHQRACTLRSTSVWSHTCCLLVAPLRGSAFAPLEVRCCSGAAAYCCCGCTHNSATYVYYRCMLFVYL
jgi:hypothetical protein